MDTGLRRGYDYDNDCVDDVDDDDDDDYDDSQGNYDAVTSIMLYLIMFFCALFNDNLEQNEARWQNCDQGSH